MPPESLALHLATFRGSDFQRAFARASAALGDDAVLARTSVHRDHAGKVVEIVALPAAELARFNALLEPPPIALPARGERGEQRPFVLALVGPTGAGKTTTTAKLAVHAGVFGGRRVGVVTLDTFRVGALEQLHTYAEIAGFPAEVVYGDDELSGALRRLAHCDVIVVDTPGRSPRQGVARAEWRLLLDRLKPDEVHLVLPAGIRPDIALALRDSYDRCYLTHALLTKLDEVPGECGVADLAAALGLPMRWVTDGQQIPADFYAAAPRVLQSLGLRAPTRDAARGAALAS